MRCVKTTMPYWRAEPLQTLQYPCPVAVAAVMMRTMVVVVVAAMVFILVNGGFTVVSPW